MNQQIDRRLIRVDVDTIIAEAEKKRERENACTEHKNAAGIIKPWFRGVSYCFNCGKNLKELE